MTTPNGNDYYELVIDQKGDRIEVTAEDGPNIVKSRYARMRREEEQLEDEGGEIKTVVKYNLDDVLDLVDKAATKYDANIVRVWQDVLAGPEISAALKERGFRVIELVR